MEFKPGALAANILPDRTRGLGGLVIRPYAWLGTRFGINDLSRDDIALTLETDARRVIFDSSPPPKRNPWD